MSEQAEQNKYEFFPLDEGDDDGMVNEVDEEEQIVHQPLPLPDQDVFLQPREVVNEADLPFGLRRPIRQHRVVQRRGNLVPQNLFGEQNTNEEGDQVEKKRKTFEGKLEGDPIQRGRFDDPDPDPDHKDFGTPCPT